MTGPGKSPACIGARMRCHSLAGTSPRNTRPSVPRLTALCRLRTRAWPAAGGASGSSRKAARPGSTIQQAVVMRDTVG